MVKKLGREPRKMKCFVFRTSPVQLVIKTNTNCQAYSDQVLLQDVIWSALVWRQQFISVRKKSLDRQQTFFSLQLSISQRRYVILSKIVIVVFLATLVDGLNAILHLLPPLAYRPFLGKQLLHKVILLKSMETKDLIVYRNKGSHLPLIFLQKLTQLLCLPLPTYFVELHEVYKAVIDFWDGKLWVGAVFDCVYLLAESGKYMVQVQFLEVDVVGKCGGEEVGEGNLEDHERALVGLTPFNKRNSLEIYLKQHHVFDGKTSFEGWMLTR